MKELLSGLRSLAVMLPPTRTVLIRVAGVAGVALAVAVGVLLPRLLPGGIGPTVTLSLPFALPVVLLLAVVLVVFASGRWQANLRAEAQQRAELLESAVIHARDSVVVLEADPHPGPGRRVLYVNDAFCQMTGYARDEVVGRSLHRLRGPDSDAATLDRLRSALDTGQPLQAELRNYRKDGTEYWVDLSLVPVRDARGRVAHWVMIQRDVTDRKRADEQLRRSEELFRGIFEGTSAGVSLTDAAGRFVSCNPAFAAIVGRTVEEVLALTPAGLTHPDDWAAQQPLLAEIRDGTRDRFHHGKRYLRPDGGVVWVELSFAAIRGPDGRYEYGLGVSIDVTEQKRLEEQLRQAQKMEAIGRMAGGIAHDFNNLLTAILGNLDAMELPEGDPNRPALSVISQASERAIDLTRKLLGYARRNQLVPTPVNPQAAFDEVIGILRRTFDPRIRIAVEVAPGCGSVLADPTLLNQALMNLCLNACDAMPDGGTLTLAAEQVAAAPDDSAAGTEVGPGPFVRLSVVDTGCGMTDAVKARIFEPFFTTKEVGKGTGLGLPMVQGIVKQHRGWVDCVTMPGRGTRIDLYLPRAAVPAALDGPVGRPVRESERPVVTDLPRAAPEAVSSPEGKTVLLVDDESMIRMLGRATLERAGYEVLTAEDGADAVEVFSRERDRIELIVMDVTMPRMSGRDAYRQIVALDPDARVLFSTGYAPEEIAELDGAVGLLGKPYRPAELLAAVRNALSVAPAGAAG